MSRVGKLERWKAHEDVADTGLLNVEEVARRGRDHTLFFSTRISADNDRRQGNLHIHHRLRITGVQGVHVCQNNLARGEVLQMTSGTGQVLLEVFLGQVEGINTIVS